MFTTLTNTAGTDHDSGFSTAV